MEARKVEGEVVNVQLIGMEAAKRKLNSLPRQARFATSRAINDVAKEVQQETITNILPQVFTVRGRWWNPGQRYGFNVKFATKDKLTATVGSRADWLKLQEEGGTKTAGAHRVAIPTEKHKPKAEQMTREKKPRALLADIDRLKGERSEIMQQREATGRYNKDRLKRVNRELRTARTALKMNGQGSKAFMLTTKSGFTGIFKRVERTLVLLFSLVQRATIRPILNYEQASQRLVSERYDAAFQKRLKEALK